MSPALQLHAKGHTEYVVVCKIFLEEWEASCSTWTTRYSEFERFVKDLR